MNYEDERYVRLYTRNTPTWCSWKWEARAVLPCLLRAVDRDGRLEWPAGDDALAVAAVLMLPVKVVIVGLRELERTKSITMGDGWLELPNFVEGQNARGRAKTGAERMADLRERRRNARSCTDVTSVTKSDECDHPAVLSSAQPNPTSSLRSPTAPARDEKKTAQLGSEHALVAPSFASDPPSASPANDSPGEESPGLVLATTPSKPTKRRGKPRASVPPEFVQAAYEAFSDARETLTGFRPRGLSAEMLDQLAKLYAAHSPSIDDWRLVVRQRLTMDQRGEGYGSLTWVSITAPANFERWLLAAQHRGSRQHTGPAPVTSKPTHNGAIDLRARAAKEQTP